MKRILVTGGAGFIGSHTCKMLAAQGFTPIAFDNLSRGHAEFVKWGPLIVGDLLDPTALDLAFKTYRPDAVVHFAALAYVGESFAEPLTYYRVNLSGLVNLLEAMARNGTDRIVFSSSCATYGIPASLPIAETAAQVPISPYGRSKLVCEQIIKDAASSGAIRFAILRYFNACGADADGELWEWHDPETHLVPLAIDAATGKAPPLQIFGADYPTKDGTCERDFIHVSDLATAHVKALRRLESTSSFEVNLGSGKANSVREVVATVERIVGRPVPLIWGPRRPGDPPILLSDTRLAASLLDFEPCCSEIETVVETAWRSRS